MKRRTSFHLRAHWLSALVALLLIASTTAGCDDAVTASLEYDLDRTYTFEENMDGWTGAFTDYSVEMEGDLELVFDRRALPDGVDEDGMALFLAGTNHSDDLFMFLKRQVMDLEPNTTYTIHYEVDLASNAPGGNCAGIGGAPGTSVYLKAGASQIEPLSVEQDGDFRLNVDKSNQASSGENAIVIGTIDNGSDECTGTPYRLITRDSRDDDPAPLTLTTDSNGSLWVFVGTESGFEGRTALYYDTIRVTFEKQ